MTYGWDRQFIDYRVEIGFVPKTFCYSAENILNAIGYWKRCSGRSNIQTNFCPRHPLK